MRKLIARCVVMALAFGPASFAFAEDKPADGKFTVADGHLSFKAPAGWVKKEPQSRIVEVEFQIPGAEGETIPGRMTVMGAGGSIDANIERWMGQFEQPDGGATKDKAKTEKLKVAGNDVHYVDIAGDYKDNPAPFAGGKGVLRKDFRMLAAIVSTKNAGNYFLKFYGPKKTVADNEKAFRDMLDSLQVK